MALNFFSDIFLIGDDLGVMEMLWNPVIINIEKTADCILCI